MNDLLRPVLDFMDAGGVTMMPLLLCCLAMWYLILRVWLDVLPKSGIAGADELTAEFSALCSGIGRMDRQLVDSLTQAVHARMRRRLSLAAVFAGIAPLLGLFGTVTGMIDTFDCVARFGMVNTKALSMGISQAMISTQTGLVVAVPGLITVYVLRRRAHSSHLRLTEIGLCLAAPEGVTP